MLTAKQVCIAVTLMGLIIFCTRAFSFVLFFKKQVPALFRYLGRHLPPLVIALLILYTLKDIDFSQKTSYTPALAAISFTVLAHLHKGNAMVSIFGGTIIYMLLVR